MPRKEATTTSMTSKSMRLQSVGQLPNCNPTAVIPAHAQEIISILQDAEVELRTEPSIVINIPPAQRNLLEELQGVDMTAAAFPQPPQQGLQLQGPTDLSELAASAARAQADKHAQPPGLFPSAAAAGKDGSVATASIFSNGLSH